MLKNILIGVLAIGLVATIAWPQAHAPRDKPEVKIYLPNGYCGDFVVFWNENSDPVDHPPEFLSYNYYPDPAYDGVAITLPEPYRRAELQFLYDTRDVAQIEDSLNPVFRLVSVGSTGFGYIVETLENGWTHSTTGPETSVERDIFTINAIGQCFVNSMLDEYNLTNLYLEIENKEILVLER